jgi:NAD(P)-dependent dehydrogenase (short-subunit alcohol dehydrogenase family)
VLLTGRSVIISGAGAGLGRALTLAFAREGARILVTDRDGEVVDATVAAARASSGPNSAVEGMTCDITDGAQCAAAAARAIDRNGSIDVLVNDAYHGGDFSTFEHADLDAWAATADVNYIGTLRFCQAVVPQMKAQGHGRIININTQGVEWIQTMFGAYSASKAALQNATRLMATELGPYGIRVNGIHPGPIWGPAIKAHLESLAVDRGVSFDVVYAEWADATCLKYLVPPEDIADAAVLLASDLARAITGQSLFVNAGHWFN